MEHEQSAMVPSNYEKLPKSMDRTADSTFDRIYKYYHDNKTRVVLTAKEGEIRDRWEKSWLLLCRHRTQKQVVDIVEKTFRVSKATAWDDVRNAMMLFSNPQEDLKDGKRQIAESMALKGADRCWKNGDMDGYWKFLKEYKEINKLDQEADDFSALLKKLKPVQVNIVADESVLRAMAAKKQEELTHDIEYTPAE